MPPLPLLPLLLWVLPLLWSLLFEDPWLLPLVHALPTSPVLLLLPIGVAVYFGIALVAVRWSIRQVEVARRAGALRHYRRRVDYKRQRVEELYRAVVAGL